jgi:hypothetical protein
MKFERSSVAVISMTTGPLYQPLLLGGRPFTVTVIAGAVESILKSLVAVAVSP